jgi:tripartite-type tricarboxylate transporter receptor subunit TctC
MELSLMKSVASRALLAAALLTNAGGLAAADEYPSRIIKLVVAAPAGGGIDIVARLIERVMSQQLGQKIIVDNRPGANGFLGATFVANAPPDGYTIFTTVSAPVTNPLNTPISYDVETAFQPISRVMASPFFLVVPESSKVKTVGDLIAAGKDPNQIIRYGHPGLGTVTYMASVLLNKMAGTNFVDIPYRGSAAQITDTLSGEIQFGLLVGPDALSRRNDGLRILGVSTAKRSMLAPDIPTIAEAGVPGYDFELWHGLFAPAKTPRPIVDKIRAALAAAQEDQDTKARFLALGMVPTLDTPEEFAAIVRNQRTKDTALARELNLKPQ